MTDNRIGVELFTDVLDVLHRHGFARGDFEHAGRAISLIGDLARIYEGSQDHPSGPSFSQAPSPSASPELPGPEPGPATPEDDLDAVTLTRAQTATVLTSLMLAAVWTRDRVKQCPSCRDQSCFTCQRRQRDARTYDQIARQILHHEQTARDTRSQPGPPGSPTTALQPGPGESRRQASDHLSPHASRTRSRSPGRRVGCRRSAPAGGEHTRVADSYGVPFPDRNDSRPLRRPEYAIVIDQIRGTGAPPSLAELLENLTAFYAEHPETEPDLEAEP